MDSLKLGIRFMNLYKNWKLLDVLSILQQNSNPAFPSPWTKFYPAAPPHTHFSMCEPYILLSANIMVSSHPVLILLAFPLNPTQTHSKCWIIVLSSPCANLGRTNNLFEYQRPSKRLNKTCKLLDVLSILQQNSNPNFSIPAFPSL